MALTVQEPTEGVLQLANPPPYSTLGAMVLTTAGSTTVASPSDGALPILGWTVFCTVDAGVVTPITYF